MSLLTAMAVLSAGSIPPSLVLMSLGKALERREGLSCLGSFSDVILSPKLEESGPFLTPGCSFTYLVSLLSFLPLFSSAFPSLLFRLKA